MKPETEKYLRKAEDCLLDAKVLHGQNRPLGTINRAYYAAFDAIQALLFEKDAFVKTHQGAQARFHELFVATGIFPNEIGKTVKKLFENAKRAIMTQTVILMMQKQHWRLSKPLSLWPLQNDGC